MNKLRVMFARISVSMLEPDLVIMDEFQRFKFLLSSDDSELGILAHSFLSGHDTRVLLLSATPYKLYSTLEEIDENQLDEHYAEFFQVMNFLMMKSKTLQTHMIVSYFLQGTDQERYNGKSQENQMVGLMDLDGQMCGMQVKKIAGYKIILRD